MSAQQDAIKVQLRAREVINIHDGEGLTVACLDGVLWITQANDADDIVIYDGQSFVLDRPGLALVSAPVGPAHVAVLTAADGVWATEANSLQSGGSRRAA
ncbi:MAG: DUF2917 domain-containing protein [Xanthobacteraceae bacterium]